MSWKGTSDWKTIDNRRRAKSAARYRLRRPLLKRIKELEAMLKRLEWSAHDSDACPICYAPENNGYHDGCALAALLPNED